MLDIQEDLPRPHIAFEEARRILTENLPKTVYAYFHQTVFFVPDRALMAGADRKLDKLGFTIHDRDANKTGYRQPGKKLSIAGPSRAAIEFVANIRSKIYSTELAIDPVYESAQANLVLLAMHKTVAQRWPGNRNVNDYFGTLYTGRRPPRTGGTRPHHHLAGYSDQPCHVTGETDCVHLEHRYAGLQLLRRIDLAGAASMLSFDHIRYWRKELPGLFLFLDLQHYGRTISNQMSGSKRQRPRIDEMQLGNGYIFRYDWDRMLGLDTFRIFSEHDDGYTHSLQQFVKKVGRKQPYLHRIPVDHILERIEPVWGGTLY